MSSSRIIAIVSRDLLNVVAAGLATRGIAAIGVGTLTLAGKGTAFYAQGWLRHHVQLEICLDSKESGPAEALAEFIMQLVSTSPSSDGIVIIKQVGESQSRPISIRTDTASHEQLAPA